MNTSGFKEGTCPAGWTPDENNGNEGFYLYHKDADPTRYVEEVDNIVRFYYEPQPGKGVYLHREDGPALYPQNGEPRWYYMSKKGIENFPDEMVAKLGDTII